MYTPNPKGTCSEVIPEVFIKAHGYTSVHNSSVQSISSTCLPNFYVFLDLEILIGVGEEAHSYLWEEKKSKYYYSYKLLLKISLSKQ